MNAAPPSSLPAYEALVSDAVSAPFAGWDFSWLDGRAITAAPSWSYPDLAREAVAGATSLLDLDTGGGELLASLQPLPPHSVATEGWLPNLPVARQRLAPLGVAVVHATDSRIPVADGLFDLVLNRHGFLDADELWRVLAPGGAFLTQQVGGRNDVELNEALGGEVESEPETCADAIETLQRRGFRVLDAREEMPEFVFYDIGAVIYQLRAVPWQIPDFDVERYDRRLRALDAHIRAEGSFVAHDHRFLISAVKPVD